MHAGAHVAALNIRHTLEDSADTLVMVTREEDDRQNDRNDADIDDENGCEPLRH